MLCQDRKTKRKPPQVRRRYKCLVLLHFYKPNKTPHPFHTPIIVDYTGRVDRTRTSFLDFIFQFGFNYRRTVGPSRTREPAKETYLSFFPLGMFEFERSATRSRNTLFWLITWSSRK